MYILRVRAANGARAVCQILPFRRENAFLPEATRAMGAAYDSAIAALQNGVRAELFVRELVAKRIIHAASIGEVDRERLRQSGLSGFARRRYATRGGLSVRLRLPAKSIETNGRS
jgi:hypothetical protein